MLWHASSQNIPWLFTRIKANLIKMNKEVEKIKGKKKAPSELVISAEENHHQGLQPKQIPFPFLTESSYSFQSSWQRAGHAVSATSALLDLPRSPKAFLRRQDYWPTTPRERRLRLCPTPHFPLCPQFQRQPFSGWLLFPPFVFFIHRSTPGAYSTLFLFCIVLSFSFF